jgi:hypothetical protein
VGKLAVPKMKLIGKFILLLILLGFFWSACSNSGGESNLEFIQGSWYFVISTPKVVDGKVYGSPYTQTELWTFNRGKFEVQGFKSYYGGRYSILFNDKEELALNVFDFSNWEGDPVSAPFNRVVIKIDRTDDTIRVDNLGPFSRYIEDIK